jgi:hypothetical protein
MQDNQYSVVKLRSDLESWFEYGIEMDIVLRTDREEFAPYVNQVRGLTEDKNIPTIVLYLLNRKIQKAENSILGKLKRFFLRGRTIEKKTA